MSESDFKCHKCSPTGFSFSTHNKVVIKEDGKEISSEPSQWMHKKNDNQYAPTYSGDTIGVRQDVTNNNQNHNNLDFHGNHNTISIYNNNYNVDCMTCNIM